MRKSTLETLVDPKTRQPLKLADSETDAQEVITGWLEGGSGSRYEIANGIPRFVPREEQAQTQESFGYKWGHRSAYEMETYLQKIRDDEVPRWGLRSMQEFYDFFPKRGRVLEVGCGSAHFASLYVPHLAPGVEYVGMDLSSAIDIARQRLRGIRAKTDFVQGNILEIPFADQSYDHIFARGVLHHTPSTRAAFESCARVLRNGGEFTFLIYRKLGPIREFTDDHIRSVLSKMPPKEAWQALEGLTLLGKALRQTGAKVTVQQDIPYLEIPAGTYDLQTLVYDHFIKAFWNPELDFETNQHNSFDWYHPQYAFHHTEEEIREWCAKEGFTVKFIKPMWTSWAVRAVKDA
jgi:arsenite methyltransferase